MDDVDSQLDPFIKQTAMPPSPVVTESLGSVIGRYKLLQQIGEGGFGVVFMAEQQFPVRRQVALKIIKLGMDTKQVVARFEAERQALAMMDHPNIAKVLDAGATNSGRPYFVMELVRGIPITQYCDENKLDMRQRIELFIDVCRAIQHAHQKGIIHRDLKPSNVMIMLHDGKPSPKVIDFGISKATQSRLTEKTLFTEYGQMMGTPAYMSPEQAEMSGLDVDTRSDVYSLGVLLYELLTGVTPFEQKDLMVAGYAQMQKMIREVDPPRPSTRLSGMPGNSASTIAGNRRSDLGRLRQLLSGDPDWIVMKCLEKDRTRRYASANELAEDLERYLYNRPIVARPPSLLYGVQKFVRRRKAAVITAALIVVTSIAAAVIYVNRIRAQERQTAAALAIAQTERAKAEAAQIRAEESRRLAEDESRAARHAAAMADTRLYIQQMFLPAALQTARTAYALDGNWEDGYLFDQIVSRSRRDWQLAANVELDDYPTTGCFIRENAHDYLVIAQLGGIRVFDAKTGAHVKSLALDGVINALMATPDPDGPLVARSGDTIDLYQGPDLRPLASRTFDEGIEDIRASDVSLLILHKDSSARLVRLPSLSDIALLDAKSMRFDAEHPPFTRGAVSPDGSCVILKGGAWNRAVVVWRPHVKEPGSTTQSSSSTSPDWQWMSGMRASEFGFIDPGKVGTWFSGSGGEGSYKDEIHVYDISVNPPKDVFFDMVPSGTLKQVNTCQFWKTDYGWQAATIGTDGFLSAPNLGSGHYFDDGYSNLWPSLYDSPLELAGDGRLGYLALHRKNRIGIFHLAEGYAGGGYDWLGFSASPTNVGLIGLVGYPLDGGSSQLRLISTEPNGSLAKVSYEWPTDDRLMPWAVASTPDARLTAIIGVQTSYMDNSSDRYGQTFAFFYDVGNWSSKRYLIQRRIPLEVPAPSPNIQPRLAALSPDGRVLLYWTAYGSAVRYSTDDGQMISKSPIGPMACRCRDGSFVAGVDRQNVVHILNVATGNEVTKTLNTDFGRASCLCFDSSAARLLISDSTKLLCLEPASASTLWTANSKILPVAWPDRRNRFLGFIPDSDYGQGGNLILADTASFQPVAILGRASSPPRCSAFFSSDDNALLIQFSRWQFGVVRNLSPTQAEAVLDLQESNDLARDRSKALPPLSAEIPAASRLIIDSGNRQELIKRLGERATIEGNIAVISWTRRHDAFNIELEGPDATRTMGWVPPGGAPSLAARLGPNFDTALVGRRIRLTGILTKYGGRRMDWTDRIQIEITDPAQCVLLDAGHETKPPAGAVSLSTKQATEAAVVPGVKISWDQARGHVGQTAVVTGPVIEMHMFGDGALLLNVGKAFPDLGRFTVFILPDSQNAALQDSYAGKTITATGAIQLYKGVPEIRCAAKDISTLPTTRP